MRETEKNNSNNIQCKNVVVSIAGKGTSVKRVCLPEKRRHTMEAIINKRKSALDVLAKY
ncbi:hypothetical protein KAR29_04970 [Aminithiophilus ramosus]|uniref:Uncharacterized protein n=1 Tax=Aminithiophilus ramosus TaxID=3029084 RepID=A0A9Q7APR3_9BACT|nr:hypothetical protein [Aminithiophilus ramosus]QTX33247.1 hypothetical protein KAR29_04970 [Aminithiophilus ramosus]